MTISWHHAKRVTAATALTGTLSMLALGVAPGLSFAATVPNLQQDGFSQVLATQTIQPGQAATVTSGGLTVSIPANAFSTTDPVTFTLLGAPATTFDPSGTTPLTAFAFQVKDLTTGALVGQFLAPVKLSYTSSSIGSATEYWNVTPTGAMAVNPVASTISGTTLVHGIDVAMVGWVVANPAAAPDFSQSGFSSVIASANFTPGQAATVSANGISVAIPANAFNIPVTFQLLQGPIQHFVANAPSGQTPVTDFAFRVMDSATNTLVGAFNAPVMATITNSQINLKSQYEDISTTGAYAANPIAPVIKGDVMTHPIKAAAVGWVVTSPSVAAATSPVTGLPIAPVVAAGAGLLLTGIALYRRQARSVK
ncbi:MAG: hypothetical protein M0Z53_05930 [Thermaerobacter sp.]|nr:hypothetical protein [Thermaerobacter sp.]